MYTFDLNNISFVENFEDSIPITYYMSWLWNSDPISDNKPLQLNMIDKHANHNLYKKHSHHIHHRHHRFYLFNKMNENNDILYPNNHEYGYKTNDIFLYKNSNCSHCLTFQNAFQSYLVTTLLIFSLFLCCIYDSKKHTKQKKTIEDNDLKEIKEIGSRIPKIKAIK